MFVLACFFFIANAQGQKNQYKAEIGGDGVQRVDVLAGEYFFNPDYIVVKVNVPVDLKVRKEPSIVPHDFVINSPDSGLDVHEALSAEPKSIKFTPKKAGKYPFYCDRKLLFFKSHRNRGMEGTLEVTE